MKNYYLMNKRYKDSKRIKNNEGITYISNNIYTDIPVSEDDIYLITTEGDRYDILASKFYSDSSLWWLIVVANENANRDSLIPTVGIQLRIPANKDKILNDIKSFNQNR